ncbi:carbon-nitrogen hydrolase family protein [Vibrio sp. Isolate30]|uniref:carbon-nitrogen hydrolase family protein n=1 Tax=Vibrio sp. Isolate30 TaxID=2908536 RepID=UPI001EFCB894|nr:carbon-nitrogen hydrolase family protein [Vibrio sp. Isolate30]
MQSSITISLPQVPVMKGDVSANLKHHISAIEISSQHNADVVVFPELSLTGYEPELAAELAFDPEPSAFKELSQAAITHHVIVIAGCPLKSSETSKPTIGSVICFPDGRVEFYSKQYLHSGEEVFCSRGEQDYYFQLNGNQIALAICADFIEPLHSTRAKAMGADVYLVSALISEMGFAPDSKLLSDIASTHKFPVLLSNHISVTGGWDTCGKNSIWGVNGNRVMLSNTKEECVVLCTIDNGRIEAHCVKGTALA